MTITHTTASQEGDDSFTGNDTFKKLSGIRFADQFAGSDIGAKINAAITDLGSNGGIIFVPSGSYSYSTAINADDYRCISIVGAGGQTAGSSGSTLLTYTGTGSGISAKSSTAFRLTGIMFAWSNASFAGPFIDLSHSAAATDTSSVNISHCSFFKTGSGAAAPVIINLDKTISSGIHNCTFHNATVAIRGSADSGSYSNANEIVHCTFSSATGEISTAFIQNPGTGWRIIGNTFEMGQAAGTPAVVAFTAGASANAQGIEISGGNWIGDNSANGTYTMFTVNSGWSITGNYINGGGSNTTIFSIANSASGVSIVGNIIASAGTVYALGTSVTGLLIAGNSYSTITAFKSGTPSQGIVTDDAGLTTVYGGLTSNGAFIGTSTAVIQSSMNVAGRIQVTANTNIPTQTGTSLYLASGYGSPILGKIFVGDGTGWQLDLAKRSASADTTLFSFLDSGNYLTQSPNGAQWTRGQASELLTLSTAGTTTDTSANLLPANSIIEAVVARITTTIATATDWKLGDATTAGRFTTASSTLTAGTTVVGTVQADQTGAAGPRQASAAKVRVTTTGTPSAGAIRITVFYRQFVAPTS